MAREKPLALIFCKRALTSSGLFITRLSVSSSSRFRWEKPVDDKGGDRTVVDDLGQHTVAVRVEGGLFVNPFHDLLSTESESSKQTGLRQSPSPLYNLLWRRGKEKERVDQGKVDLCRRTDRTDPMRRPGRGGLDQKEGRCGAS